MDLDPGSFFTSLLAFAVEGRSPSNTRCRPPVAGRPHREQVRTRFTCSYKKKKGSGFGEVEKDCEAVFYDRA